MSGAKDIENQSIPYPFIGSQFGLSSNLNNEEIIYSNWIKNYVSEFELSRNDLILKISCAGCEYNILKLDAKFLREFRQIVIEYNYGYKSLVKKLTDSGFTVSYSKPRGSYGRSLKNHNVYLGMIIAENVNEIVR